MTAPLRIGLIGAGWVTQYHLAGWASLEGRARVVAIADPDAEKAEMRARQFGIASVYTSAEAMLKAEKLDAVDIATPRQTHVAMVRLVAQQGLPVICQKPLAPTFAEAEQLVADVKGRIRLMVHENWRFRAYYRQIATWLKEGRIGTFRAGRLTIVTSGTLPDQNGLYPAVERQPFIRFEKRMLVNEVLIHHLDTLRMLLGTLEVKAASMTRTCPDIAGEDGALMQLGRQDGTAVSVFASFAVHGAPAGQTDHLELVGDKGVIRLDGGSLECLGHSPEKQVYDLAETYQGSYTATIRHFVDCLANGDEFATVASDNLATLRLVEDFYRLAAN